MKKYIISILAMSALLAVACNKEIPETDQIPEEEPGIEYELTATLDDQQPETEASIDFASTGKVSWVSTDKIAVWTGSSFVEFTAKTISADGYTATFSATISGTPTFGKAYYPASIAGSSENQVVLPSSYATVAAAADGFPMMSDTVTPGQPVTFKHLGSFLKLTVNDAPSAATKFTVTSLTSGKYLSGTFTTNYNNGSPALTATSGNASVTVPKAGTVYLPIPADTYSLRIEVKNNDGFNYYRRDVSGSKTFVRANLKKANITVTAPSRYFAKTVSSSGYWDGDHILLQGSANVYEVWVNCDGGTVSYIYDEYNIGNDVTGAGCLAHTAQVNDGNKYKIEYNTSSGNAAMTYISRTYDYPYDWNNLYTAPLHLHGSWDGSNWTDSNFAAYDNGKRPNHVFEASLTTTASTGEFGLKAGTTDEWWSADSGDSNYGTITAGAAGIYYCNLIRKYNGNESRHYNQSLTNLPVGTYKVYANVLNDQYDDRPIRVMFVKQ